MIKIKEDTPIVIPESPVISGPCRDLLTRCLDRNPRSRIDFPEFFDHAFLDLEHMPTDNSEAKADDLIAVARRAEKDGDSDEALAYYKSALDYLAPLLHYEKSRVKRLELTKKVERHIAIAERLKGEPVVTSSNANPVTSSNHEEGPSTSRFSNKTPPLHPRSSFESDDQVKQLVKLCSATPQLKTALEIMDWAELYELEGQYTTALEKYEFALGMILPNLSKEPKGHRKTLLYAQTKAWMSKAEHVKELIAIQEKELKDSKIGDSVIDQCKIS